MGRGDFIVVPANERAVAFLDSYPDWPAPAAALYGPPACGKSHLAAVWAQKAQARILEAADLKGEIPDGPLVVENIAAGKAAFAHRALMNSLAALGKWKQADEKAA